MINANQLRLNIVRPALEYLDPHIPYSETAENLLMGTAAQESRLGTYVVQHKGPALGIFQMEPATEEDIFENYLRYQPDIRQKVYAVYTESMRSKNLTFNLLYAAVMCRISYYRHADPLPDNSPQALGEFWKKLYNTPQGKGSAEEFADNYNRLIDKKSI